MTDFAAIGAALGRAGVDRPALVLDRAALAGNLAHLASHLPAGYARRIADKSLPAPGLIRAAMAGLGTDRIMSFDLRLTSRLLDAFPAAQVLMGKPMPISQAAGFLERDPNAGRVTWLIDSAARAAEYAALGPDLPVVFEVDIGLGRGGFANPVSLRAACLPGLRPVGLMGYEAHVAALPVLLGRGARAQAAAMRRLVAFAGVMPGGLVNTGGSSTALGLPVGGPGNELVVGSAIVKPSDFDQPVNAVLRPALFLATPVLKCVAHGLPGHPRLSRGLRAARIIGDRIAFGFGGKWMARPVWPEGLRASPFYGPSSNQQGWVLPRGASVPGRIFLRPTQSEAVIQDFAEIAVYEGGEITELWPVWPPA